MSYGGNKKCYPSYFRTKQSNIWEHFKEKEKRGDCLQTHSDTMTFTMVKDSSNLHLVNNGLDYDTLTPRVVKRFNKKRKGNERWKGLSKVILIPLDKHINPLGFDVDVNMVILAKTVHPDLC